MEKQDIIEIHLLHERNIAIKQARPIHLSFKPDLELVD